MSRLEVLEQKNYLTEVNLIPMRFTVELLWKNNTIKHVFRAVHLEDLCTQIQDEFPKAKVISVIGGG